MEKYTDVEAQVEYGLEKVDSHRKIEISLKDLLYLHQAIEELVRFFHQPTHYSKLEDVKRFLGDRDRGAFHLLMEIRSKFNYRDIFPVDIQAMIESSDFDHPNPPYYYES